MKRIFPFALLVVQIMTGQQKPESVFFTKVYEQYTKNPTFLSEIPLESFTKSSLFYNQNKGDLRLGQQNGEEISFGLATNGMYKHNQFIFWGKLKAERLYEKNKKWNLSYTDVLPEGIMPDPHYFAVSKSSEWNSQRYDLSGGVLLPLIGEKWDMTAWVDYDLRQRFRTEYDPRPSITQNFLALNLATGIKFSTRHKIALGGKYGYGKVKNETGYSEVLIQSPVTYEKYLRWMVGYGTPQNTKHDHTKRNHTQQSAWLAYHYKADDYYLYAYGAYKNQYNRTYQNSNEVVNESEDVLGQYTINTVSGLISYLQNLSDGRKLHISTEASNANGFNFLASQQGKNYVSTSGKVQFDASLLKIKRELIHYDAGLSVAYDFAYQKDVLSETLTEHSHLSFAPYFRKEYALRKISVLPQVKFVYHQKLHNTLVNNNLDYYKNISETDYASKHIRLFYEEVVYPDFNYFDRNRYEIHFGADFKKPLHEHRFLLVGFSTAYKTTFMAQKENRYHLFLTLTLHY
ncbi:MAG: hypothetical protein Q4C98_00975 [Capnocytophaga sp.]|nr:hypothetical protein [Capnocytophaga sp.]